MTNIENIINFFETLNERGIHFLTSDKEHFDRVVEIFRIAKNRGGEFDIKTALQLTDHYNAAQDGLNREGKPYHRDFRSISDRIESVKQKGTAVKPQELYDTVVGAIRYGALILTP